MIPLFLNPATRLCVVIGGGTVGQRKARMLLDGDAHVRLICLEEQPAELRHDHLVWTRAAYRAELLDGAALVFAAATAEVNRRVVMDARGRGLWVNSATEPGTGDFHLPAILRCGGLTVAVGTDGQVPGMARAVRDWLAGRMDDSFGDWLSALAELRPEIYARTDDPQQRETVFRRLCDVKWLETLPRSGPEELRRRLRAELERLVGD